MPMCVGKNKNAVFAFLTDRVGHKLQGWANKELSKAGKLTLLKSAAQTIPNFWMNLFLIPAGICDDIEKLMNGFWWGRGANGKGIRWLSWEKLSMPKSGGGLGVKRLRDFNVAMLAKQGWRILNNKNPLVSAIIKARYFPDTNFLNAELGANPSYVWRSILAAKDVIKANCRRKIGNGAATSVWSDPWLPDVDNGLLTTPMPVQLRDITVQALIDMEGRNWDLEVLCDICNDRDVELIKRVPIPTEKREDSWFWLGDDKGQFTVRNCYRLLQGGYVSAYTNFWKRLWSLKMPGKIANFLWRVCKGCLPTACALALKHVDIAVTCPWCHVGPETDTHILFECDFAKTVWSTTDLFSMVQTTPDDTAFDVLRRFFAGCSKEQCVMLGMICWSLWNRRNKWVWERANGSAFGVKSAAMNLLHDWREAQVVGMQAGNSRISTVGRKWSKPPDGWLKVNVDATGARNGGVGVGCVVRNSQGEFVGARCKRIEGSWSPKEAEAISLKEALSWMKGLQQTHCIFETDSEVLALACKGREGDAYFDTIVSDCKHELKHFDHVLVEFVYRSANCVAHLLANAAHSMSDLGEWFVTPPDFINHVLVSDML